MKNCPNCHNQAKDEALFCPVCGTMLDVIPQPEPEYFQPAQQPVPVSMPIIVAPNIHDHTDDYGAEDIRENKLSCMCAYLLNVVGVIIALLMSPSSDYAKFHIRQSLKLTILEALIAIASAILCWTFLVPILGLVALVILSILRLICFIDICKGRAKDAPILRELKFLN